MKKEAYLDVIVLADEKYSQVRGFIFLVCDALFCVFVILPEVTKGDRHTEIADPLVLIVILPLCLKLRLKNKQIL